MFSRFFIDRPIFASVLSIIITLAGAIAVFALPMAQYPEITPPTVEVSAVYPGANAQVVADTVAAPIEQQVNGVENMMYMSSQCTNDGTYTLTVTFKHGVDLNMAQVLVQNRVSLAEPILPDLVKRRGVTVKKKSPSILMIVNLFSPDNSRDNLYLSNYATIQLRDELSRLAGVGDITYLGQRDYSMRVWLDPQKMAFRNLISSADVVTRDRAAERAGRGRPARPAAGPNGQVFQFTMTTLGRLTEAEQFDDMIFKTDAERRRRPAARRGQDRARRPGLRPGLHARRPALGRALDLSAARLQRAGDRRPGARARWRSSRTVSRKGSTTRSSTTRRPFIRESVDEVFNDPARRRDPGRVRRAPVPAELAVGDHSAGRRAGGDRRHVRRHGRAGLQPQQPDAVRAGAGHRHRGRRRDRGRRGGRASHRAGPVAARCRRSRPWSQVSAPVIAVGLVLTAVFVPCAFISGITGQFYRQFALTIATSTVISAFNSLTLSPALSALLLRPRRQGVFQALPWLGVRRCRRLGGLRRFLAPWLRSLGTPSHCTELPMDLGSRLAVDRRRRGRRRRPGSEAA